MKIYTTDAPKGIELNTAHRSFKNGKIAGRYLMKQDLMPIIKFYEKRVTELEEINRRLLRMIK